MNEDLIGLTVVLSAVTLVATLVVLHGSHKAEQVHEAWRKLAERHQLQFQPQRSIARQARVTGSLGGRPFRLERSGSGNQAKAHMELDLLGALPNGLRVHSIGAHAGAHREVLGVPVSEVVEGTGEVKINDEVGVRAADAEELPDYLTATRMRGALRLGDVGGELDDHKLRVALTKNVDDLEELDSVLRTLAKVAPLLDTP
jgi:hypothetical protein